MDKITENTLIPISALVVLAGFIFWLSALYFKTEANAKALEESITNQQSYMEYIKNIDQRLSRMEGYLKKISFEVQKQ